MIITTQHTRALQYCNSGVREFCKKHNINYQSVLKQGITEEELSKIDDVMSKRLIDYAKSNLRNG